MELLEVKHYGNDMDRILKENPFILGKEYQKSIGRTSQYNEENIQYLLNSMNYRCDEFDQTIFNNSDLNIIFTGCSYTFGFGIPSDHTWPHLMHKELMKVFPDKNIPYFNLGMVGCGLNSFVRQIMNLTNTYSHIDMIVVLAPGVLRREVFSEDMKQLYKFGPNGRVSFLSSSDKLKAYDLYEKDLESEGLMFYRATMDLMILKTICKSNNIKLMIGFANDMEPQRASRQIEYVKKEINFYKQFRDNYSEIREMFMSDETALNVIDLASDLSHYGVMSNTDWVKRHKKIIIQEATKRIR